MTLCSPTRTPPESEDTEPRRRFAPRAERGAAALDFCEGTARDVALHTQRGFARACIVHGMQRVGNASVGCQRDVRCASTDTPFVQNEKARNAAGRSAPSPRAGEHAGNMQSDVYEMSPAVQRPALYEVRLFRSSPKRRFSCSDRPPAHLQWRMPHTLSEMQWTNILPRKLM